jgi:hypothetical protein
MISQKLASLEARLAYLKQATTKLASWNYASGEAPTSAKDILDVIAKFVGLDYEIIGNHNITSRELTSESGIQAMFILGDLVENQEMYNIPIAVYFTKQRYMGDHYLIIVHFGDKVFEKNTAVSSPYLLARREPPAYKDPIAYNSNTKSDSIKDFLSTLKKAVTSRVTQFKKEGLQWEKDRKQFPSSFNQDPQSRFDLYRRKV